MNGDKWLPWRDNSETDSEDSTHEDEVIERCDHEFEESAELLETASMSEARFEEGHLVIPQYELVEEFCTKCGEPGINGEVAPSYDKDSVYLGSYEGKRSRLARRLVFKPEFEMDPDVKVADGIIEVVESEADYVGLEDGEVETVDDEDGSGRVLVNQSDEIEYGVTD